MELARIQEQELASHSFHAHTYPVAKQTQQVAVPNTVALVPPQGQQRKITDDCFTQKELLVVGSFIRYLNCYKLAYYIWCDPPYKYIYIYIYSNRDFYSTMALASSSTAQLIHE